MPRKGDRIGSYILLDKIGRGGFGEVWLAEKRTTLATTKFALKLPNDAEVNLDAIRAEAEVWCSVSGHPNVLPIIEADIYDGQIVIASEYVQGGSLADWLKQSGGKAPTIDSAIQMTRCILDGLEFLHGKKVLHRDLKPENILLQEGIPRLTDFGISRVLQPENTSTKQISGTIAYMPPEAFEGKHSLQTDLWSVGVVFYQMLTGRLPFDRNDYLATMRAIATDAPESLPSEIPVSWREFIAKALTKDRKLRFQTATEMKKAWEAASRGEFRNEGNLEVIDSENSTRRFSTTNLSEQPTIQREPRLTSEEQLLTNQKTSALSTRKTNSSWIVIGILLLLIGAGAFVVLKKQNAVSVQSSDNKSDTENAAAIKPLGVKKYLEMSESEKQQFVFAEADKILRIIQKETESEITPAGKAAIKSAVDYYAKRRWQQETKDSCGSQTYDLSDLATVLKRGAKIAPDITAGFREKEISPVVGIYLAMNESEFCPCMRGWTNGLGIYQFSTGTAIEYGLKASKDATANNPDERCNAEPASHAAATLIKKLMAEDFGNGANQTTFALTAYLTGENGLRKNIEMAKRITQKDSVSFWMLLDNTDKMSEEFKFGVVKYLPRFFAAAIVGENPQVFDVAVQPLSLYDK
jgi:serine/threonine protein kinase